MELRHCCSYYDEHLHFSPETMCHVIRFLFLPDGFDLSLTSPCVVRVQVHRFLLPTEQYVHSLCENPKAVDYRLTPVSQSGLVMANGTGMDEKRFAI